MKFTNILITLSIALILAQALTIQRLSHKNKRHASEAKNPLARRIGMLGFNAMKSQAAIKCTGTAITGAYYFGQLSATDKEFRQSTFDQKFLKVGATVWDNSDSKAFITDFQDNRKGEVTDFQLGSRVAMRFAHNRVMPLAGGAVAGELTKQFGKRGYQLSSSTMMNNLIAQKASEGIKGIGGKTYDEFWMQSAGNFVKDNKNLDFQVNEMSRLATLLVAKENDFPTFKLQELQPSGAVKASRAVRLSKIKRSRKQKTTDQKTTDDKYMRAQFAMSLFDDLFKEKSNYQDNYCLAALEDLASYEKSADALIKDKSLTKDLKSAENGGFVGAICPHLYDAALDVLPYEHEIYYLSQNLNFQAVLDSWVQSKDTVGLADYLKSEPVKKLIKDNSLLSMKAAQTIFFQLGEELNNAEEKTEEKKVRLSKKNKKSQSKKNKKQKDGETCPVDASKGIDLYTASLDAKKANADNATGLKDEIAAALKKVIERK